MENQLTMIEVASEYKQAAIEENGAFSPWLMDEVPGFALFMLDREGKISAWSRGAARLTGFTVDEVVGQHFSCLYDNQETQLHKLPHFCLGIAVKQGFYENKGRWKRQGASNFPVQVQIMHIVNNGGGFVVMVWDISKNTNSGIKTNKFYGASSPLGD
jgi:PAS domain S-box-containing protein